MRVIAGQAKGRKLKAPAGSGLRPTGDRLKEALFSIVGDAVRAACVLDLYAGTGALGIEALSRGADRAVFVDNDPGALETIKANLAQTGLGSRATVVASEAERFARRPARTTFDLVLVDPPYDLGLPSSVLELLLSNGWLDGDCRIVAEASSRRLPVEPPAGFVQESERRFGDSALLFLALGDQAAPAGSGSGARRARQGSGCPPPGPEGWGL